MAPQSDIELNNVLRSLVPISNLSKDSIEQISASSEIQTFAEGYIIFNEGDNDEYAYYLLEGKLELISTNSTNFQIISGTDDARYPLAQFQPRQYTAKAVTDSMVLAINRTFLDSLLVGNRVDNSSMEHGVEVNDIDSDDTDDWMSRILQSPLYINISVENIHKIFTKIESLDVKKGEVVINQGDDGDFYYIIQIGRCSVSRKPTSTSQDIKLTELREGDAFGEESIIANLKRNASVTMLTDGRLMRLEKNDFKELILNPILKEIDFESAQSLINKGAVWLDVRYPDEYQDYAIEGSLNIPLNLLRLQVEKLDKSRQYIVCCDTASRSSIAAYILAQNGYDVLHLNKGLKSLLRDEDIEQIETQEIAKIESTNVVPFKNSNPENEHVLSSTFHDEMTLLREELDSIKNQFKELSNVRQMATELKKTVISDTEKKLKIQRERINLQTQNANKLIQQAQKLQQELKDEKRFIHEEVDKSRLAQEQTMHNIQKSINQRLMDEEKKMQEFYSWKDKEIKKIRELKKTAEQEYLANKIENELKNKEQPDHKSVNAEVDKHQADEKQIISSDLKEWLKEQVKNELSPINQEVQQAKRRLIEQANLRAEKSRKITKIHDQTLSTEINNLVKGIDN
ncbi:MAG: cyclic nucleotide-binding domain-containing protein [Proteobacteria bacterium]|nr:cyclic nucleotide-binding domain-containing protein [Pseudomonadota bacterium]